MSQLRPPVSPRLLSAPTEYEPQFHNQYTSVLRQYFNQIDNALQQLLVGFNHYGTFYTNTTQTNPVANTANFVTFTTTGEAFGIAIDGTFPTRINCRRGGIYSVSYSVQTDATGAATDIYIWLRKNGVDVPASASRYVVSSGSDERVATRTVFVIGNPGDYFQLVWASPSTNALLAAFAAAAPVPAIPSAVVSVQYVYPDDRSG